MNSGNTTRFRLRRLVFVIALLYGISIGLLLVPRVVGIAVPEALRATRNSAYATSQKSTSRCLESCCFFAKGRAIVARLWNDFQ
jgi:ABC-type cobalamin transport system permease subunit